jgi:methionyl-tRNA formyltransferase
MKVLYFGDPRAALGLIESTEYQIKLCGLVHGRSGGEGAQKLASTIRNGPYHDLPRWHLPNLNDPSILQAISQTKPDLIVSVFFPRLIPQTILDLAPGINVHPSDLPKWRGPDPSFWVISQRESETAISIHSLTAKLDEGDIIYKERVKVRPRESGGALAVRLERQSAQLMVDYLQRLSQKPKWRSQLVGIPQTGETTWAPLMEPDDLEVNWGLTANRVDAFVRAAAPDPCAFSGLGNELMIIHRGRVADLSRPMNGQEQSLLPVGQALIDEERCLIRCGEGFYQLDEVTIGRRRVRGVHLAQLLGGLLTR